MFFATVEALLAHVPGNGVPVHSHFHLWHVAIVVGLSLCVLLVMVVAILDLRKAVRDRDEELVSLRQEVGRYRASAESLRQGLAQFAREDGIVAEELASLDPRFASASEMIARRGRQLEAALDIVTMVQAKQREEAERLARTAKAEEKAVTMNRENAAALERSAAELEKSAKAVSKATARLAGSEDEPVDYDKLN